MRISVVITTYNAGKHLEKQLDSLRTQSLIPDEVLIFDDGSTDGTVDFIKNYICLHKLDRWRLQINEHTLGWKRNFMEGLRRTSGDLLFPCDQDDSWYPEKLEEMTTAMDANPEILLLACDYHVIYEPGAIPVKVYQKTKEECVGLTARYRFTKHFFMNPNPGCSYAIRKSFFDEVNALWFDEAPHDEFLWLMATIQDGAYFYNRTLMDYIRYAGNASAIRYKDIPMQQENLRYIAQMLEKLESFAAAHPDQVKDIYLRHIRIAKTWCTKRQKLMQTRNLLRWLLLAPWWGYYNSPKNCLSDLWLAVFGKFTRNTS